MKIFGKKLTVLLAATALVAASVRAEDVEEETKTLDELYEDAIAEGGNLVYYAGGDLQSQQTAVHDAFVAAYPEINFTIVVDYSKYHDVRIDNQLDTDTLVPDITALQTVQNFPRWDQEGKLLAYKPAGFSKIYDDFKSENGTWMSHMVGTFSFFYDRERLAAAGLDAPKSAEDLIDPQYAGHIASTYPHDDDAALFVYTRYVEKYGWDWVAQLAAQDLQFKRGSNTPGDAVDSGDKLIGVAAPGSFYPSNTSNITFVAGNGTQYLTWGQHIAILKDAKNPAAAKLFLNWILSTEIQTTMLSGMSVRTDIDAPAGYKHLWEYEEGSTDLFPTFMEDRAAVEHWKQTFALYFGEVQGEPSPGWLGLHPGA